MKLGIIYAGQGSQVVGMGKSFYPREIFDQNEDLKELCFNGPLEKLSYTPYTQPCMVMVATIITDLLKEHGIVPDYTAGLSLGEYSALYCAGVFKRQQVIDLARFRGKVMQEAVSEIESEMIAVLGMKEELLQDFTMGKEIQAVIPALGNKEVTLKIYFIKDMGTYAVWRATKATGGYDARTFQIKARPTAKIENLRPGMSVLVKKSHD